MEKRIAIIGAGVSGLLACKHTVEKGFNPTVFEAGSGIGGVWSKTIESTKLQTPKSFYQFSDFPWPTSVKETFPDHNQVMEYFHAYAEHFNLFPRIKFNSRVINIDYVLQSDEDLQSWNLWGGNGKAFSSCGKWNVTVLDTRDQSAPFEMYEVDFVILCIGKYSDLPNIPEFPSNKGPEVFDGDVLHSMDYGSMEDNRAAQFIKGKRVTVIGFQKSAVDIAAEIANGNGPRHPCTLFFRTAHWMVPDHSITHSFKFLNRCSQFLVHKPGEGVFLWLLAFMFSPLLCIFSRLMECYLKWTYPLKKYQIVPAHDFIQQIYSCMFTVLPSKFYDRIKEGSIILKKTKSFSFCKNGLLVDSEATPLAADVVIFATGYKGDTKLEKIFAANYFQRCIIESSLPFYRDCVHPRIPQLAILGYADSPAILHTTEMRSKWIAHFLAGNFKLPTISEMVDDVMKWGKCAKSYGRNRYRRSCVSPLLQIYCNDQLCKDMGYNPRRKKWFLAELFSPYVPADYSGLM